MNNCPLEEDPFLRYTFLNVIFYEFVTNSYTVLKETKSNTTENLRDKFIQNNRKNLSKYEEKTRLLLNFNKNNRETLLNEIKKLLKTDINYVNNIQDNEEYIFELIRKLIIFPIKSVLSPHNDSGLKLNEFLSVYCTDYITSSFTYFYYIIKFMKKNECNKTANLAQKYLFEEEEMKRNYQNKEKDLRNNIKNLKNEIKEIQKKNSAKFDIINKNNKEINEENKRIKEEFDMIKKKYEKIGDENKKKDEKIDMIEKICGELTEENKKKDKEIDMIKKICGELTEENKKKDKEIDTIKEKERKNEEKAKKQFDEIKAELNKINKERLLFYKELKNSTKKNEEIKSLNFDLIKQGLINSNLFNSYSKTILELETKNYELTRKVTSQSFKLDKLESENTYLYAFLRHKGILGELLSEEKREEKK